jgi:hypothetical protein
VRLITTTLAALALAVPSAAEAVTPSTFRLPSRNIGCTYWPHSSSSPANLRCDVLSGLKPEPRAACELDWTGANMGLSGRARATCAGDTAYPPRGPILAYGKRWRRDGLTCLSALTGLRCTNRSKHGFVLARTRWSLF